MMETCFRDAIFVLILFAVGRPTFGQQQITCSTPDHVYEEDSASLICHFNEDLHESKHDFYVYRYRNDGSEPVIVTLCEHHNGTWTCDTMYGFSVEAAHISDEVTIKIKSAELMHSGQYVCKTLPGRKSSPASACSLNVKETPTITCNTRGTVSMGDWTSLTCTFEFDLSITRQDFYVYKFYDDGPEPVIIALCTWNKTDGYQCEVDNAYNLSTARISRTVTLEIQHVTGNHTGNYICKTLPAQESPVARHCSLIVQSTTLQSTADKWTESDSKRLYYSSSLLVGVGCLTVVLNRGSSAV